jgi:hypothetical protein
MVFQFLQAGISFPFVTVWRQIWFWVRDLGLQLLLADLDRMKD